MTKNPSRKLSEVWISIIPQVIIRVHFSEWEVVVVSRPRRIFQVVLTIPQVIRMSYFKFQWKVVVVVVVVVVRRPCRGVKILRDIDILIINSYKYNDGQVQYFSSQASDFPFVIRRPGC